MRRRSSVRFFAAKDQSKIIAMCLVVISSGKKSNRESKVADRGKSELSYLLKIHLITLNTPQKKWRSCFLGFEDEHPLVGLIKPELNLKSKEQLVGHMCPTCGSDYRSFIFSFHLLCSPPRNIACHSGSCDPSERLIRQVIFLKMRVQVPNVKTFLSVGVDCKFRLFI